MASAKPDLTTWIGRRARAEDVIAPGPVARLAATLDREDGLPQPGDVLPPAWYWPYFLGDARQSGLGPDGHEARGGLLPPIALPRRMWAGGRFAFHKPLHVGERATRESEIVAITPKQGRAGRLVFVTVRHLIAGESGAAVEEEHDIVYRETPRPDTPPPAPVAAPAKAVWRREVAVDPALLFRFSALTFNSHRIHYDRDYCRDVEGYPGLVVHGPLMVLLLLDLVRRERPRDWLAGFDYRALAPVFDGAPLAVCGAPGEDGRSATLWIAGPGGGTAMQGNAALAGGP